MKKFYSLLLLVIVTGFYFQVQAQCPFTPTYPTTNLIADPDFNAAALAPGTDNVARLNSVGYDGAWGTISIIPTGYCGTGVSIGSGGCSGGLGRTFTVAKGNALKPLTKYRVKVMAEATGTNGLGGLQLDGLTAANSHSFYFFPLTTNYAPVDFTFYTGATVSNPSIAINTCTGNGNGAILVDNFEVYEVPGITASVNGIAFDPKTISQPFTVSVSGSAGSGVTLVPPTGITLSTTSIVTTQGTLVTATWDGTTPVSGNIELTDGTLTLSLPVTAVTTISSTYTPLNTNKNYIQDPEFNAATLTAGGFSGWGSTGICTDPSVVQSGTRCGAILPTNNANMNQSTGSLDRAFTSANGNALKTLTKYVVKAKVWAVDGPFVIGLKNYNGGNETTQAIPQSGTWTDFNENFATGATIGGDPRIYFGNWGLLSSIGYIDNWEVREVPGLTASVTDITMLSSGASTSNVILYVSGASALLTATHIPAGITINPTTLDTIKGNSITVTWDKAASISDNLTFSCGNYTLSIPVTTTKINNDVTLSNITISTGALNPVFNTSTTTYNVVLPGGTTTVTATATKNDSGQLVTGDGAVDLTSGSGTSTIKVTADDGITKGTYTINYTVSSANFAMSFPGGTDGTNINVALPALNISSLPVTIEMMIKPATDMGQYGTMFGNRVSSACNIYYDPYSANMSYINYYWNTSGHAGNTIIPAAYGSWHHIALVVTSTNTTLYVDGVPSTTAMTNVNNVLAANSFLGWDPLASPNQGRCFKGLMDEVRIWNVARTAQELQDNKGVTLTGKETGLVGYWNFDNQQPTLSTDLTGNGHDGVNHATSYAPSFDKTDATLSALSSSLGSFDQTFSPDILNYNVSVPAGTASVTVDGTAASGILGATLSGTGIIDVTGVNPKATIVVTAPNRVNTKTYILNFTINTGNVSNYDKNLFATVSGKQVLVNGTVSGDVLKVYNASGQLVKVVTAVSDKTKFTLNSGIYFVKVNVSLLKVIL
jgi:hypothetical protein